MRFAIIKRKNQLKFPHSYKRIKIKAELRDPYEGEGAHELEYVYRGET